MSLILHVWGCIIRISHWWVGTRCLEVFVLLNSVPSHSCSAVCITATVALLEKRLYYVFKGRAKGGKEEESAERKEEGQV